MMGKASAVGHVYFDATFLHYADRRGIYQVAYQLIRFFLSPSAPFDVAFLVTQRSIDAMLFAGGVPKDRLRVVPTVPLLGGIERLHGLFVDYRYRAIVPHARLIIHPEPRTVLDAPVAQAVMFHDLMELESPYLGTRRKWTRYLYLRHKYRRAVAADHIWTNSVFTRDCLLSKYPSVRGRDVRVVPLGVRSDVAGPYQSKVGPGPKGQLRFVYVGAFEPRKNVEQMLLNFAQIHRGRSCVLNLVGGIPSDFEKRFAWPLECARKGATVVVHKRVDDIRLRQLYHECHFLLFPSLREGFGMPILEAMSFGLVALAFRNSAIPEACGDAGVLADDNDFRSWGDTVGQLCSDPAKFAAQSQASVRHAHANSEPEMWNRYKDYFAQIADSSASAACSRGAVR